MPYFNLMKTILVVQPQILTLNQNIIFTISSQLMPHFQSNRMVASSSLEAKIGNPASERQGNRTTTATYFMIFFPLSLLKS